MSIIYTKEYNGQVINITDDIECSYKENYANEARTAYDVHASGAAQGHRDYWGDDWSDTFADPYIIQPDASNINPNYSWTKALYFTEGGAPSQGADALVLAIAGNNFGNSLGTVNRYLYVPDNNMWDPRYSSDMRCTFSTNIPIFETQEEAEEYCAETVESERQRMIRESAVNYKRPEAEPETKRYFIWTEITQVDLLRGNATEVSGATKTYRSTAFDANTMPALYFINDGDDFQLGLKAPDVVAGYSLPAPQSVFEQVPEESWHDYEIGYEGVYYTDMPRLVTSGYDFPADGRYTYGIYFYTNIPIMENEEAADEAIDSGDYSQASNWENISGDKMRYPDFGDPESSTTFGAGTFSSPFVSQYVMSTSDVRAVSSIFFGNDQGVLDDIKKGLELYGAKPVDAIMSLVAFPFDVTDVVNCSQQYYIYFGSYKHDLPNNPVNKVMNCLANYLDAGTVFLAPLFSSYRDFKNLTLSVYLPFIGWRDLEIEKYISKSVNIRYYIDINTRQCAAVLVAGGVMADYFVGEIGIELPIVGSNFAEYARSEIQHLSNTAKGMLNPFSPEALSNVTNGVVGASEGVWGNIGGTAAWKNSSFSKYGQYKFGQNGSPKDMQMTKGSFTSGVGMYLPQYVMFRYDIHDVSEPQLLNELCGKPSTASGKISQFSGFLSGRVSRLVTTGMTDSEITEVQNAIMNDGIYI